MFTSEGHPVDRDTFLRPKNSKYCKSEEKKETQTMARVSSPAKLRPWSELTARMVMGVVPGLVITTLFQQGVWKSFGDGIGCARNIDLGGRKPPQQKTHKHKMFAGLSSDFGGISCYFFPPSRMTPQNHINKIVPPTQSRDNY